MIRSPRALSASQRVNIDKVLATVACGLILIAVVVIASTPPATGYEISIYDAYPSYFWGLLIASIACAIVILVRQAFAEERSRWWVAGFAVILLTNVIMLFLPVFRGYAVFERGDLLTHIGYIKDILFTGHAGEHNFYPVMHILSVSISEITALDTKLVVNIIPPLFSIFYMVSIYLLSTRITKSQGQSLLITAFGSLLLFKNMNLIFAPAVQSFFLIPFILFLYYRTYTPLTVSVTGMVPFILMLLLIPFMHPMTSLWFILILLCIQVSVLIYKQINKRRDLNPKGISLELSGSSINPSLLVFVTFFIWYSSFSAFAGSVKHVANWLLYRIGEPGIEKYPAMIEKAGLSLYEFTELFIKMHGQHLLYFLISAVLCIIIWRKVFHSRDRIEFSEVTFSVLFIVLGMLMFVFFVSDFIIGYQREMRYPIFASTVLNGLGLYSLFHTKASQSWRNIKYFKKGIAVSLVIILLLASIVISSFNLFFSPIVKRANHQVTYMELVGMEWFFEHRDQQLLINDIAVGQLRFADALQGKEASKENIRHGPDTNPPDHFGYNTNEMIGGSFDKDRYLIINRLSRIFYPEVYPEYSHLWRFTEQDFERLNHDLSVDKVYSDKELEVFYVNSQLGSRQ